MDARQPALHVPLRRRLTLAIGVLALATSTLAGACGSAGPTPSSPPTTVWQAITDGIGPGGNMDVKTALQAFAYVYGVDLPGVRVPDGRRGNDSPQSGTAAFSWVLPHWPELTPEQRAVVMRYGAPQPGDRVVEQRTSFAGGSGAGIAPATRRVVSGPPHAGPSDALVSAFESEAAADLQHIGQRLGLPILTLNTITFSGTNGGNTLFTTFPCRLLYADKDDPRCVPGAQFGTCNIVVWSNTWSGASSISPDLHVLMTHEVVHCYQNSIWTDLATASSVPKWITEGSALWLAADDTGVQERMVASQWKDGWFAEPGKDLDRRTYDGFAYLALLHHLGRDLWGGMAKAWRAANAGAGDRTTAFIGAFNGDDADVLRDWGPSMLNNGGWGTPWVTDGFGVPGGVTATQGPAILATKEGYIGSGTGRSAVVQTVDSVSDEIVWVFSDTLAAVHESNGSKGYAAIGSQRFCVKGDCVCPPNTLRAGEKLADDSLTAPFVLAVHGGSGVWKYQINSISLADECGDVTPSPSPSRPPPSGGGGSSGPPCPSGCGSSNGDPHLTTVDRNHYDFQAAGEYVLVASKDRSVEVQARQEPFPGKSSVAINTALAVRVAGRRVGVAMTQTGLAVRLDGSPVDATSTTDLGGGGALRPYRTGVEIDAPDGTKVFALSLGRYGINAIVVPSAALRTGAIGLLGTVVPNGAALPALPDGTRLPRVAAGHDRYQQLYGVFGPAWRVTQQTSLFDYDAGKTTDSYTVAGFPAEQTIRTIDDVSTTDLDAARAACPGITDQDLLLQCLFDVIVTGIAEFGALYLRTDIFIQAGPQVLDSPPPGESPSASASGGATQPAGIVTLAQNVVFPVSGAAIAADGTLYISTHHGGDTFEVLAVDPAAGTVRQRATLDGSGIVAIAAGSIWVGEQPGGLACDIRRLDPTTLATQTTIKVPCDILGPQFAAVGDDVWFIDRTGADIDGHGGHLRHIDPATNQPDSAVELPYLNGFIKASATAIFLTDNNKPTWRLRAGETAFQSIGVRSLPVYPAGDGVWTQESDATGNIAARGSQEGGFDLTVQIDGPLVGADESAVYIELPDKDTGLEGLWRVPADGGAPTKVALGAKVNTGKGEHELEYFDNDPLLFGNGHVIKLWLVPSLTSPDTSDLLMQATALP